MQTQLRTLAQSFAEAPSQSNVIREHPQTFAFYFRHRKSHLTAPPLAILSIVFLVEFPCRRLHCRLIHNTTQMSFTITLRQGPARLATRLPQLSQPVAKNASSIAARAFHQSARRPNALLTGKTTTLTLTRAIPKTSTTISLAARLGSRRGYQSQAGATADNTSTLRKLAVSGAIFGGTLVLINGMFNRETREDGGMPAFERSYLNSTFLHTGLGIGIIAVTARQLVQNGFVYRMMVTNPWVVGIGGLALSFGTMIGTRMVDPDK